MTHEKNAELFASLEKAKFQLAELLHKTEADAGTVRYWEKQSAAIVGQLLTLNKGLVASIAAKLKHLERLEELVQVGNIAMAKAIEKFNPELGCQFATYAYHPIRGAMLRAINKNRTVHIPEEKIGQLLELKKAIDKLRAEQGDENDGMRGPGPSPEDLAYEMNLPVADVRKLLVIQKDAISLDGDGNDPSGLSPYDVIADTKAVAPSKEVEMNDQMALLQKAVDSLTPRDAEVFLHGGGYFGRPKLTFEKIGLRHGFSRQRAQQIFEAAKRSVEAFVRSSDAACSGQIARKRLGLNKNTPAAPAAQKVKSTPVPAKPYRLKTRAVDKKNPNHHIWLNNGTWYCKFALELANGKTSKICNSLNTKDVEVARKMRDRLICLYNAPTHIEAA